MPADGSATCTVANSQAINCAGYATGSEPVVDVDDRDVRGATVQHPEERGQSSKTCAVTCTCRHSNHRYSDEAGDNTRKRALHSGDANNNARGGKIAPVCQQTMDTCDAYVEQSFHSIA